MLIKIIFVTRRQLDELQEELKITNEACSKYKQELQDIQVWSIICFFLSRCVRVTDFDVNNSYHEV